MNTISEAILIYRNELLIYMLWFKTVVVQRGNNNNFMAWGEADYIRAITWSAKLDGMVKVLGISKEEEVEMTKEFNCILEKNMTE